jgi:hypothetical protein
MVAGRAGRYDYRRDDALRRIRVTVRVPLESSEFIAIVDRQAAEGTWAYGLMCDLRAVYETPPPIDTARFFETVQAHTKAIGKRGPVALLTRAPGMLARSHGYAKNAAARGFEVELFWDLDEAEDWLQRHTPRPA